MDFSWLQIIVAAIAGVIGTGGIAAIISAVASYLSKRREIAAQSITESQRLALDRDKHTDDVLLQMVAVKDADNAKLKAEIEGLENELLAERRKRRSAYAGAVALKRHFNKLIVRHCPDDVIEVINAKLEEASHNADAVIEILAD